MIQGIKTKFYTDVKLPIKAGMQFGTKDYKLKVIGHETIRLYYDSVEKDWQVGREKIKRIIKY